MIDTSKEAVEKLAAVYDTKVDGTVKGAHAAHTAEMLRALAYNAAESENNLALHQLAQVKYKLAEVEAERDQMRLSRNHWAMQFEAAEAALATAIETLTTIANQPDNMDASLWAAQTLYIIRAPIEKEDKG